MNEEYNFLTLSQIRAKMPSDQKEYSSAGLIVDCTNPHRKDSKKDYCMRLKIIDPAHPNDQCSVFLYAKSIEDFPRRIRIGDILVLHKFGFEIWNDCFQAKKHFKVMGSFFRFFSGDHNASSYSAIDNEVGLDDSEGKILNLINKLRAASKTHFSKNAIPLYSKNSKLSSDFDLILKVQSSIKTDSNSYKIHMTNTVNEFEISYCDDVPNGVYKIRSIADLSWAGKKCTLVGNDYTCFLEIPSWMKSHEPKDWEKLIPSKTGTEQKARREKIGSKNVGEKKSDRTPEIELRSLVDKNFHHQNVKVSCEFVEVFTSYERALRKFDAKNFTEKSYESQEGEYIYNIHFAVTDSSLNGEVFNIYLYTFDGKGAEFLSGIDPKKVYGKNLLENKEKYDHLINRLLEESDFNDAPIELTLSPLHNGKETIYRIVDTELLL